MSEWISSLDVRVQVALIGIVATLITLILKDVLFHLWREKRADEKTALSVYRNYADPLLHASISLFWRLRETLVDEGRGAYLKNNGSESEFDKYKFDSTLYRLATIIAWLRAYKRELAFFSVKEASKLEALHRAIAELEKALADGDHVEGQRLRAVSDLWGIPTPTEAEEASKRAVAIEHALKHSSIPTEGDYFSLLQADRSTQERVCRDIADYLANEAGTATVPPEVLRETLARAAQALSTREAWLYRDFQSGIGDLMIEIIHDAGRRFDVIGFKGFEQLLQSEDKETKRWVARLFRVFDELDIAAASPFDARLQMLE